MCAIERAVKDGKPCTKTSGTGIAGGRRATLHGDAAAMSRDDLDARIEKLKATGKIVPCTMTGAGNGNWLDVPGGALASLGKGEKYTPDAGALRLEWEGWADVPRSGIVAKVN